MSNTTKDRDQKTKKTGEKSQAFSAEERAAMRALVKERKANQTREEGEKSLLAAIAAMPTPGRGMAERLHEIISTSAPNLAPKTWYGMPAYANEEGKVVCFFRGAEKFKERYMTFGFNQEARVDEGKMWPTAYALTELTAADEKRIAELVKKAMS